VGDGKVEVAGLARSGAPGLEKEIELFIADLKKDGK
jgi:hypothetical protein